MNRILITLLTIGAGAASAASDGELLFGFDLNATDAGGNRIVPSNTANATKDELPVPTTGGANGGNMNYENVPGISTPMSTGSSGTYQITEAQTASAGLSLEQGFTYAMNYAAISSASNWQIFGAVAIGDVEISANFTDNGFGIRQISKGSASGHATVTGLDDFAIADRFNTLTTLFITGITDGTTTTLTYSLYNTSGDLLVQKVGTLDYAAHGSSSILEFRGNGYDPTNDKNGGGVGVSHIGVFAGIAAADQMEAYAIGTTTGGLSTAAFQMIPEPSTATLSLLALAGLLARRRRTLVL